MAAAAATTARRRRRWRSACSYLRAGTIGSLQTPAGTWPGAAPSFPSPTEAVTTAVDAGSRRAAGAGRSDRSGRPRDTLVNLENGSKVSAMILPGTWDASLLVNQTAEPGSPERSEWMGLADPIESPNEFPPYHQISAAVLECELAELHPLPDAVATLAILRVRNILRPDIGTKRQMPPDAETWRPLLAQFGWDRLTSGPDGSAWSFEVRSHRD